MMRKFKRHFGILILAFVAIQLSAQNQELIKLKTFNYDAPTPQYSPVPEDLNLRFFPEDSLYAFTISCDSTQLNLGIWSDYQVDGLLPEFRNKIIVYDKQFNPMTYLEALNWSRARVIGTRNEKIFLNIRNLGAAPLANLSVTWTHNPTSSGIFLVEYDMNQNQLTERLTLTPRLQANQYFLNFGKPFWGYGHSSGFIAAIPYLLTHDMIVTGGGYIRTGPAFYDSLTVNNTAYYNPTNQMSYMSVAYNTMGQSTTAEPIIPPQTSLFNFRYFPSTDPGAYYRVGSLRGDEAVVNPGGDTLESFPTDSSYVAYISKENTSGESEFITRLYSYNNLQPDTMNGNNLSVKQIFESLVEWNDRTYLSQGLRARTSLIPGTDSLFFTDIFGTENAFYEMVENSDQEIDSLHRYPYAKHLIYVVSDEGEPQIELSRVNGYAGTFWSVPQVQKPLLFKVGEKLAWTANYAAVSDTTLRLIRKTPGNATDTTYVELPAGKGSCIFWLDADLNLDDVWNIPYSAPDLLGVQIGYIGMVNSDTLVIQGHVAQGTTTSLDPIGNSPAVAYPNTTTFLAFFSSPTVDIIENAPIGSFKIYPNPANKRITISKLPKGFTHYGISNLVGQQVQTGTFTKFQETLKISVEGLAPGMYILNCFGNGSKTEAQFVVK